MTDKSAVSTCTRCLLLNCFVLHFRDVGIESEEVKIKRSIKQAAKRPDSAIVCRTLAKELIASRKAKDRIHTSKAQLNSISMQLQQQASAMKIAGTMAKSTQIMKLMNNLVKVSAIRDTMMNMSKEMMKVHPTLHCF